MITVSGVGMSSHLVEVWTCDHSEWSGRVIAMSGGVDLQSWRFLYSNGTCVNTLPKGAGINPPDSAVSYRRCLFGMCLSMWDG